MARWLSWLERRPVTAEVTGSSPVWVVHKWTTVERLLCILCINYGILAQLGEHLPYKQRVTGSSPVGPIFCFLNKITCRSGGTGRRPGLKIPWVVIPVPVRFRSAALVKDGRNVGFTTFLLFFCFKMFEHLWTLYYEIPRFWKASLSFFLLLTFRK